MECARDVVVAQSEGVAGREGAQVHARAERTIAAAREHDRSYFGVAFRVDDGTTDRAYEVGRRARYAPVDGRAAR